MRALLFFLSFTSVLSAQSEFDLRFTGELPIYYFPFYDGVQLIEIDYFSQSLARGRHGDGIHPRGGSDYHDAISLDTPNGFILRSSTGRVIKTFGIHDMNAIKVLPPNDAATITHRERLNMPKLGDEFEDYTWKDANGYGYRFRGTKKPDWQEYPWLNDYFVGIIDTLGNVMFQEVDYFSHVDGEYLVSSKGKFAIYDSTFSMTMNYVSGTMSRAALNRYFHVTTTGETNIVDRFGKKVDDQDHLSIEPARHYGGYLYSMQTELGVRWGIMRSDLSYVTPALYIEIKVLPRGYAVSDSLTSFALLNEDGVQITDFGFERDAFRYYEDGTYTMYKRHPTFKEGMIDSLGNVIIPLMYDRVKEFRNGIAGVCLNNKWGIVNRKGEVLSELIYSEIIHVYPKHIQVRIDKKEGILGHNGEVILEPNYTSVSCFDNDFLYLSNTQNERFFYNTATKEAIPCPYYDTRCFQNGYSSVEVGAKSGMIDTNMRVVIPIEYDLVLDFQGGTVLVRKGEYYGLYNANFELIKPPKFKYFRIKESGGYEVY